MQIGNQRRALLLPDSQAPLGALASSPAGRLLSAGWGFDWVYDRILVQPFAGFARVNAADHIDDFFRGMVALCQSVSGLLSRLQNGRLRWFAAAAGAGSVIAIYLVVYA